jgi:hypothetical protein
MLVSQLPVFEIDCPMKNSRKLRLRSEMNVLRSVPARSRGSGSSGLVEADVAM